MAINPTSRSSPRVSSSVALPISREGVPRESAVDGETVQPYKGAEIVQYFVVYGEPRGAAAVPNPGVFERAAGLRAIIRGAHEPSFRGQRPEAPRRPSGLFPLSATTLTD